jgi:hypothetical protein
MDEAEKNAWKEVRKKFLGELREVGEIVNVLFPTPKHVQSPPPTREQLLRWATECRLPRVFTTPANPNTSGAGEKERREQVLQIVEESRNAVDPPSVAEIFEEAYGDAAGSDYWRLWLKFGSAAEFERLLTAHFVVECRDLATAGHPLGWSWPACCAGALGRYPSGQLADRIRSIADDEELGYLVAPTARAFLVGELPSQTKTNVNAILLKDYLKKTATPDHTQEALRILAEQAFPDNHITDALFRSALQALPAEQKRPRGGHDRTMRLRNSAK